MFHGVDTGGDDRETAGGLLGVGGDAASNRVHGLDHGPEHLDRHGFVVDAPVRDDLRPAGAGGLRGGDGRHVRVVDAAAPAVEELAELGQPGSGVPGPR